MKDIKFRGMCADGIMYYGRLSQDYENSTRYYKEYSQRLCWTVGAAQHNIPVSNKTLGQYTGLKDKNGVEIYECDNVEVDTTGINYRPELIKGVVKYIDGCFTVEFTKPVYDNVLKCMRERLYVKCFTVNKAIKVIGNIHESEPRT